jgi:hypothetical protein
MQQWSLALQKQLPGDWLASASYLGNRTVHLEIGEPLNYTVYIPGNCAAGQYGLTAAGPCSNTANTNFRRILYLADPTKAQAYGGVGGFGDGGDANYNALLLSVQHRFTKNYTVNSNYTWSHCLTENEVALNGGGSPRIPTDRHNEYGACLSDRTHAFNTSLVVKTPRFGSNVLQKVFGNWQESTIFTASTGSPFTVAQGTDNTRTGGGDLPNVIANPELDNPTIQQWFNVKAFEVAPIGVYGNEGKNILRGPGAWNMDIALTRSFPIGEGRSVDFRSEIFNVMNHARFGNPSATMNSPTFGQITSARDPRIMQFALKYIF